MALPSLSVLVDSWLDWKMLVLLPTVRLLLIPSFVVCVLNSFRMALFGVLADSKVLELVDWICVNWF